MEHFKVDAVLTESGTSFQEGSFHAIAKENVFGTAQREPFDAKLLVPNESLTSDPSLVISKSKLKKLKRRQELLEKRVAKRKQEKQRKKENRRALRAEGITLPGRIKQRVKKACSSEMISKFLVVFDLDFISYMSAADCSKVVKQITRCYSENWKAKCPLQMHLSSFSGAMKKEFLRAQPGCINWHAKLHEQSFLDIFEKSKIVYLSAESSNAVEVLEDDKVYIIGGFVDHNQHKGLCYRLANERGLQHGRLPIDKYVRLASRNVLAVNHVFEILLRFYETKDWETSFYAVIPKRKGVSALDDS